MKRLTMALVTVFLIGTAMAENQQRNCILNLTGLTVQQTDAINQLISEHQSVMDELRMERRSTTDRVKKDEIRSKMLEQRTDHQAQMKEILTLEQWSEYQSLSRTGKNNRQGTLNQTSGKRGKNYSHYGAGRTSFNSNRGGKWTSASTGRNCMRSPRKGNRNIN